MASKLAAGVCAGMLVPAAAFVSPVAPHELQHQLQQQPQQQQQQQQPPALRATVASADAGEAAWGKAPGTAGAASVLLASAGVLALSRRRSAVARGASTPKAQPRFGTWLGDKPVVPVPGSEKALAGMVGADVETGGEPWDPLGFSKLYDRNFDFNGIMTYPHVQWLRESELKHGRICMLAFVGMVVQHVVQIPGQPVEADWTKAYAACSEDPRAALGLAQIGLFTMFFEGKWFPEEAWLGQMSREAGDFGFDPLKLAKNDLKKKQLSELKNGRLAMIGVASMAASYAIPGSVPLLTGAFAVKPESGSIEVGSPFCGKSATPDARAPSKMAARYTTQIILPALQWIKTGLKAGDLQPTQLRAKNLYGTDVLVGKDGSGKVFCVANLCPHIGTPMSEGADVIGDVIICPLHGSSFKVTTGELIDWCPSPPIIGPLTGLVIERKNLAVFDVRSSFFGGDIEVLIDTNAKRAYEADYWKGILDAQGKDDGSYY